MLCKREEHNKIFGDFDQVMQNHRQSDVVRMKHCLEDGGQDVIQNVGCIKQYISDITETNRNLKNIFASNHKEWL